MTNAPSEAQEVLTVPEPDKAETTIKVEPFGQGMLTVYWDEIIDALRASGSDDIAIASMAGALRAQRLITWGLWNDNKVQAIAVTGTEVNDITRKKSCIFYAFHGQAEPDSWQEALRQMEHTLKQSGYSAMCALTAVQHVVDICTTAGFQTQTICMKEF